VDNALKNIISPEDRCRAGDSPAEKTPRQRQGRRTVSEIHLIDIAVALALAAAAAAPYLVAGVSRSFVNLDDDLYVYGNPHVSAGLTWAGVRWAFTAFQASNWHPLTWLSHMLDVSLFGLAAYGHHLTNILLHALATALLFTALRRLTGAIWPSAFVAALFGVHPLHVESVAWVAERKDVLSGVIFALVLLAYERFARRGSRGRMLPVALLLALGLAAKPMLVTVPFLLLLLDFWPLGRLRPAAGGPVPGRPRVPWARLLAEKTPLLLLAAASSVVTYAAQEAGGSVARLGCFPPAVRLANAAVSVVVYLNNVFWPTDLSVFYPLPLQALPPWMVAGAALALAAVSAAVLAALRRRGYLAVGWFWFLGMLVPVIGIVQVGEQMRADRYLYLPLTGLGVLVAWGLPELLRGWRRGGVALGVAAVAGLALLGGVAAERARDWRDAPTLFSRALAVTPNNRLIVHYLCSALILERRYNEAGGCLTEAVRVWPWDTEARAELADLMRQQGWTGVTQQPPLRAKPPDGRPARP